jgi:hypothetical protein
MLAGFEGSGSLFRLEIPASVEIMRSLSSAQSDSLHEVGLARGSRIRKLTDFPVCESAPQIYHFSRHLKVACLSTTRQVNDRWFSKFTSLPPNEIPASPDFVDDVDDCPSLASVVFQNIRRV